MFQQSHDLFQRCAAFFLWVHVIQKRRFRLVQHGKACGAQQEDPAAAAHSGERRLGALVADGDALRAAAVVDDCLDKAVQCLLEDGIVVLQRLLRQELVPLGVQDQHEEREKRCALSGTNRVREREQLALPLAAAFFHPAQFLLHGSVQVRLCQSDFCLFRNFQRQTSFPEQLINALLNQRYIHRYGRSDIPTKRENPLQTLHIHLIPDFGTFVEEPPKDNHQYQTNNNQKKNQCHLP